MTYVKINETLYPAMVNGKMADRDWDNRESKAITLEGGYEAINTLFPDGTAWSIVEQYEVPAYEENGEGELVPVLDKDGNPVYEIKQTEYANSEFCIRGDLIVHVDGNCTVKMGKPTDLEDAYEVLYGGV